MKYHLNFNIEPIIEEVDGIYYTEEWKDVKGYEGLYGVSTFGRFYSMRENIVMRQWINDKGYLTIGFQGNGNRKKYKSHRVVAIAFIDNPENKPEINHDDFDKLNNFYKNLLWATSKENISHAIDGGKIKSGGRKIKPLVGEFPIRLQVIVDTETGEIIHGVSKLVELTGYTRKHLGKMLRDESTNTTKYKWTGEWVRFYKKRHESDMARYLELRSRIYGVAI